MLLSGDPRLQHSKGTLLCWFSLAFVLWQTASFCHLGMIIIWLYFECQQIPMSHRCSKWGMSDVGSEDVSWLSIFKFLICANHWFSVAIVPLKWPGVFKAIKWRGSIMALKWLEDTITALEMCGPRKCQKMMWEALKWHGTSHSNALIWHTHKRCTKIWTSMGGR